MGRLYRRKGVWYLDYYDEGGIRRRPTTGVDACAHQRACRCKGRVEAQRVLGKAVENAHLAKQGLLDPSIVFQRSAISAHVLDYATHLEAEDVTAQHKREVLRSIRLFLAHSGATRLNQLRLPKAEAWIVSLRRRGKASNRTLNKHRSAIRAWARWLTLARRLPYHPFEALKHWNEKEDPRRPGRGLQLGELAELLSVVPRLRSLYYETAVMSGLRRSELNALRAEQLQGNKLVLVAAATKNRAGGQIVLPENLAERLRQLLSPVARRELCREARVQPRTRRELPWMFPSRMPEKRTFYRDLARARVCRGWPGAACVDPMDAAETYACAEHFPGKWADFHGLRRTLATILDASAASEALQMEIMRHSDRNLLDRYATPANAGHSAIKESLARDLAHHLAHAKSKTA